jgi:hypothetical protein
MGGKNQMKKMFELTPAQCKAVSGGSGYLIASGRGGEETTSSSTERSGYLIASGRG